MGSPLLFKPHSNWGYFAARRTGIPAAKEKTHQDFPDDSWEGAALDQAEATIRNYPLKAADVIRLAATTVWTMLYPGGSIFISGDRQWVENFEQRTVTHISYSKSDE